MLDEGLWVWGSERRMEGLEIRKKRITQPAGVL